MNSSNSTSSSDSFDRKAKSRCRRAKVVYSYTPMNDDELELAVDDVIEVLDEIEEGWWMGYLNGRKGVFPSNFVVEQSREERPPSIANHAANDHSVGSSEDDAAKPKAGKGMGFGNIFLGGAIKLKSTNELSPDNKQGVTLISPTTPEEDAPKLPPKRAREQARVLFSYEAQNEDELTLIEGSIITIITKEVEDAGWWKGELNGKVGVFPDNFVEIISAPEQSPVSKPNRPDFPICALTKSSGKPSASNAPAKPKEAESKSPVPPPSTKKPQIPSPLKKPQRSPKPAITTPPATKKGPVPVQKSTDSVNSNGVQELLTDDMKAKSQDMSSKDDFGALQVNEEKLTHLTANRAKIPNRRPPSQFIVKDSNQSNGIESENSQPSWMKELKSKNQKAKRSSQVLHDNEPKDDKPGKPLLPNKPLPPQPNKDSLPKDNVKLRKPSPVPPTEIHQETASIVKEPESISETAAPSNEVLPAAFKAIISELKEEINDMKANTVPKSEFLELKNQYTTLKEAHENQGMKFNKKLLELMNELDEEKKIRMSMKVEVDRIKKLAMS